MTSVTASAEFFCRSLAWGIMLFSFLANARETGMGLRKLTAGISLGGAVSGVLFHGVHDSLLGETGAAYLLGILAALMMFLLYHDSKPLYGVFIVSMTMPFIYSSSSTTEFLFSLSSAALLGIVTYAMVLGHWYLVAPGLSNLPLLRAFALMGGLLAIKLMIAGYYSLGGGISDFDSFGKILVVMRILWGYVVVVGMGYFGYRLARMRSIQSATGILYAMTFAVFIGELGSHYLYHHYGVRL